MLGDSLTDGRGSTTNGNDRWPDRLLDRLQADPATGGRRGAQPGRRRQPGARRRPRPERAGPARPRRAGHERRAVAGGLRGRQRHRHRRGRPRPRRARIADDLIAAYDQIIVRAHAHGIRVYGATLPPFGGNEAYDDPAGHREAARAGGQRLDPRQRPVRRRHRLRRGGCATRPTRGGCDQASTTGDHLHLNPAGYRLLADAVPLELFRPPA